jgi:hypothetical protein
MEQPVRIEGAPTSTSEPTPLSPHLLSRDYEDYLDWLENQRRSRTGRGGGVRSLFGVLSVFGTAAGLAGTLFRRR